MREKNRKSIEIEKMLPQFTTMNVIDGQAGLISYSSLIFYSLTIDNILNIIVLLILAGVSIAMLTGENGILTRATDAKEQTGIGDEKEAIKLAYSGAVAEKRGNGDVTADDLNREFGTNGTNATATDETDGTIKVTFRDSQREYMIDVDGNITDKIGNNLKTVTIKNIYGDDYEGQVPDEITIQYEDGMTWEEFVNSDYNINDSINIDSENRITIREYDGCVVSSQLDDESRKEEASFQIDSNREYYFTLLG